MGLSPVAEVRLWQLALFPFIWCVFLMVGAAVIPPHGLPVFFRVGQEGVKALALAGCLFAALGFERGDYLRGAWLFNAGCFTCLLVRDLALLPALSETANVAIVRALLSAVANTLGGISAWRFGRAWSVAELPDPDRRRLRAYVAMGILALVLAAGSLLVHVRSALAGNLASLVYIASELGDIVSLCLIAPVLPTALALRGGSLAWPWSMLAVAFVGWLLYDAAAAFTGLMVVDDVLKHTLLEICRAVACLFTLASGVAQRRAAAVHAEA